jgi:uncharacterized protein
MGEGPGLDNKTLTSWSGLMISACVSAYRASGEQKYLQKAEAGLRFMQRELLIDGTAQLYHTWKEGRAKGAGLLDDYACMIAACLDVFEVTGQAVWARQAEALTQEVISTFDKDGALFHYAPKTQTDLIVRKVDYYDNATPSANSVFAGSLIQLGHLFENRGWIECGESMLIQMRPLVQQYPLSFAMWGLFMQRQAHHNIEIQIVGPDSATWVKDMQQAYLPNGVLIWCSSGEILPILADKQNVDETLIYQCRNFTCGLPQKSPLLALKDVFHALDH